LTRAIAPVLPYYFVLQVYLTSLATNYAFLSSLLQLIFYQATILFALYILLPNLSLRTGARIDQCLENLELYITELQMKLPANCIFIDITHLLTK
jgi:hypothetical protein